MKCNALLQILADYSLTMNINMWLSNSLSIRKQLAEPVFGFNELQWHCARLWLYIALGTIHKNYLNAVQHLAKLD